jgi:hypothetical protein
MKSTLIKSRYVTCGEPHFPRYLHALWILAQHYACDQCKQRELAGYFAFFPKSLIEHQNLRLFNNYIVLDIVSGVRNGCPVAGTKTMRFPKLEILLPMYNGSFTVSSCRAGRMLAVQHDDTSNTARKFRRWRRFQLIGLQFSASLNRTGFTHSCQFTYFNFTFPFSLCFFLKTHPLSTEVVQISFFFFFKTPRYQSRVNLT